MMYKVSAIVPAYNEEKKIFNVLSTLVRSRYLNEVICVNDGSTDSTLEIIKTVKGVVIVNLDKNYGKAYGISKGIQKAKGEITVFIDADINGLHDACIKQLITPLIDGEFDATIGYRSGRFERLFFKPLSGERAYFKKDLLPYIASFQKKGYGLEVYLNNLFKKRRVKTVELKSVTNTWKHKKQPYETATRLTFIAIAQVASEIIQQKKDKLKTATYLFLGSLILSSAVLFALGANSQAEINKMVVDESVSSYKKYEKILISKVIDPVKDSTYFKDISNFTNTFISL